MSKSLCQRLFFFNLFILSTRKVLVDAIKRAQSPRAAVNWNPADQFGRFGSNPRVSEVWTCQWSYHQWRSRYPRIMRIGKGKVRASPGVESEKNPAWINPKGDAGCLWGSLILQSDTFKREPMSRGLSAWRPASARFPTRPRVRIAGERRRWRPADLANDPASLAPCSFYVSAQFTLPASASSSLLDPHLPHLSQTPWTPPPSPSAVNKGGSLRRVVAFL